MITFSDLLAAMDPRTFIIALAAVIVAAAAIWTGFALGWWESLAVWLIGDALILAFAVLARKDG